MPRTSTGFIDRLLVTAEAYSIPATIIFNKLDLIQDEYVEIQNNLIKLYESLGYTCLQVSTVTGAGIEVVKEKMKGKVTLLIGHSGVGKSSIVNCIQHGLFLKTSEISSAHAKGKHTTTFTELFELNFGGFIIDSPGIKELGLLEMKREEVGHYFPEFRKRMNECKFNNCIHMNEPGCVIVKAVEAGEISEDRFINYVRMIEGDEMDWKSWELK